MPPAPTLLLIDGHAQCFQAYHALKGRFSDPQGRPTNAIFGVLSIVRRVIQKFPCTHVAAIFDSAGPTFRHDMFPDYKGHRSEMDEELSEQIPRLQEILTKLGFKVIAQEGVECDDIIGTLAKKARQAGLDVVIVSDDKDFGQCLGEGIRQYKGRKDLLLDASGLPAEMGVRPDQVTDYLAMVGDSSDNVPGIPGIGPKTASELLMQFGSADEIYRRLDEVKGDKKRESIRDNRAKFDMAKRLVTLDCDVPLPVTVNDLRPSSYNRQDAAQALTDLGFRQIKEEDFHKLFHRDGTPEPAPKAAPEPKPEAGTSTRTTIIHDEKALRDFLRDFTAPSILSLDTETTGFDPYRERLVGLSFSWDKGEAAYVAVECPEGGLGVEATRKLLGPLLQNPHQRWVGHNLKFDLAFLRRAGLEPAGEIDDTLLLAFAADPGNRRLGLDELASDRLGEAMIPIEDLIGRGQKSVTMDKVPVAKTGVYAGLDADMTLRLWHSLQGDLPETDRRLDKYRQQEIPLTRLLLDMEEVGMKLDIPLLKKQSAQIVEDLAQLEERIHAEAGGPFNISSPKQLQEVLFTKLGLPSGRKTKTGYSTDSQVLAGLARLHPVPAMIEEHRGLSKLLNTYVDALPELCDARGILHTSFSQTSAITGRVASTRPNLQNIPVRSERGRAVREAFLPARGDTFVAADYSQVELRLMAHFSADPELCRAFEQGQDIHRFVAAEVNGVSLEDVSDEQRSAAKAVNFGILYGQGAFGLAGQLGIPQKEASAFIERYFARFSRVKDFIAKTVASAEELGYVETLGGHRRPIPELRAGRASMRQMGGRIAINTLMQGSAADLVKEAMLRVDAWLRRETLAARMVLQVHDELIVDTPSSETTKLLKTLPSLMTDFAKLRVPLVVDTSSGKRWSDV
ncbi:MAG: DNA polymerase I [Planctomycetota bacterium]